MVFDMTLITNVISANLVIVILLGILCGVAGAYILMINNKYPLVDMDLHDRGTRIPVKRRRVGDMLCSTSLITLIFNARNVFGEDIKKFEFERVGGKKRYQAKQGAAGVLIPIHFELNYDPGFVKEKEIVIAKKMAMEYINLIDEVNKTLDATNPFIIGLLSVLPLAIVILLLCVTVYLVLTFVSSDMMKMLTMMDQISQRLNTTQESNVSRAVIGGR
jgi:hypothetical protein